MRASYLIQSASLEFLKYFKASLNAFPKLGFRTTNKTVIQNTSRKHGDLSLYLKQYSIALKLETISLGKRSWKIPNRYSFTRM